MELILTVLVILGVTLLLFGRFIRSQQRDRITALKTQVDKIREKNDLETLKILSDIIEVLTNIKVQLAKHEKELEGLK